LLRFPLGTGEARVKIVFVVYVGAMIGSVLYVCRYCEISGLISAPVGSSSWSSCSLRWWRLCHRGSDTVKAPLTPSQRGRSPAGEAAIPNPRILGALLWLFVNSIRRSVVSATSNDHRLRPSSNYLVVFCERRVSNDHRYLGRWGCGGILPARGSPTARQPAGTRRWVGRASWICRGWRGVALEGGAVLCPPGPAAGNSCRGLTITEGWNSL
jgi:hypothetical protein